tara:strand:+ start:510 stop:728 length:219 start_codon:yes stop_codon:yes gene_type:complete
MSKTKFPVKKYRSILDFSLDYSKLISSSLKKNLKQISYAVLEIEKKIKKKILSLFVVMEDPQQLQIILFAII